MWNHLYSLLFKPTPQPYVIDNNSGSLVDSFEDSHLHIEENHSFHCDKCGFTDYYISEVRACGSWWQKLLNVQHRRFKSITCEGCGYTRFFEVGSSWAPDVIDLSVR